MKKNNLIELENNEIKKITIIDELNKQLINEKGRLEKLIEEIDLKNCALIESHRKLMQKKEYINQLKKNKKSGLLSWFYSRNKASQNSEKINLELVPIKELNYLSKQWISLGNDPQFALVSLKKWQSHVGWHWLRIETDSEKPLIGQIYFDVGNGFNEDLRIKFTLHGKGLQEIPILIPKHCINIRFDPCDFPTQFVIKSLNLLTIDKIPDLEKEYKLQFRAYELLGAREGNITDLVPINSITSDEDGEYTWRSESDDPWFILDLKKDILTTGWNKIEVIISTSVHFSTAKIYFDYGEGYTEENSLELPIINGEPTSRLFYLKKIPKQTRFDPVENKVCFSIRKINIHSISKSNVEAELLNRLVDINHDSNKKSFFKIKNKLIRQAKKNNKPFKDFLFEKYNDSFSVITSNQVKYNDWIVVNEYSENKEIDSIVDIEKFFDINPCISILMPVYNTDVIYLRKAIDSVLIQSYSNWELCIADDRSSNQSIRDILKEYSDLDKRIKISYRKENGHISEASNSALKIATGEFVALLDHDDELAKHALFHVVRAINNHPSVSIVYSDEDKIDEQGIRSDPHFKPEWNPDQFYSQNYISHLGVYKRELLNKIGGFRVGVEGSQDHDLLLRCLPHIIDNQIIHIPKILYHWRALAGSTALDSSEKSYTTDAGIKSLQDYFVSIGKHDVVVESGIAPNTYRVRYPLPDQQPLVSLLIPTRDMLSLLKACIESIIKKTTYQNYEILILDNGSVLSETLAYFAMIQANDQRVKVIEYNHPFNYSAINNFGAKQAKGEIIGLINNDIEVISPDWLTEMVSHAIRPEIGCVGAKLYYDDDTIQHAGVIVGLGGVAGHSHKHFPRDAPGYFYKLKIVHNVSAVTAACLLLRKSVFEEVGGLEVEGLKIAFNDVDLCLKVREAGYRNLWTPYAELYHYESKSRGFEDTPEKIARFNTEIAFIKNKWGDKLKNDPCYSPNLTLAREDFSI